jgi:hypothetical protein
MDPARISLMRWLRRQLRQPLHVRGGCRQGRPGRVPGVLADAPFSAPQRRYIDGVLDRWDREKAH